MSESDRVALAYVAESVYGSTPVSAAWQYIRFTGESLGGAPRTVESQQIRADRQVADIPVVGLDVGGAINFELSAESFTDFMAAAMCSSWSAGVLKIGTDDNSFSIEKEFQDLTNEFFIFRGMRVGQMDLSFRYGEIVTGSFTFAGNEAASGNATESSAITAVNTNAVMDAAGGMGTVLIDGVTTTLNIQAIELTLNNNLRPVEAVGNLAPVDQNKGRATLTGNLSIYLANMDLYDKVRNNTSLALDWSVSQGTKTYAFRMPNVKLTDGSPQGGGPNTDVIVTYPFQALFDASSTQMRITYTSS